MINDIDCTRLQCIVPLIELTGTLMQTYSAGNWRFSERYPQEFRQLTTYASDLVVRSTDRDVVTYGHRIIAFVRELNETDRMVREGRPQRSLRRQVELFNRITHRMESAFEKIKLT